MLSNGNRAKARKIFYTYTVMTKSDLTALTGIIESGQWDEMRSIDGFFAGVYETSSGVYLFCERLGIYNLFYCCGQQCVHISPSVPDLLRAAQHHPSHCKEGVVSLPPSCRRDGYGWDKAMRWRDNYQNRNYK